MLAELTYPVALPVGEEQNSSLLLPMGQNQQVTTLNSFSHTSSHLVLLVGQYHMHGDDIGIPTAQTSSLSEEM